MTIGFPYVPEGICILSDRGDSERPDRLENSQQACGTTEVTRPGGVAMRDVGGGGEGESGDGCDNATDAVEPCCGGR